MFRTFPKILAIMLLCLWGVSCQQMIPDSQFDARKTDQTVRNLTFTNVKIKRSPDRKLLNPPVEPYLLGPGDIMEIEIAEVGGTLARTFVMPDGMVYYNLAGGVHAEGLTTAEFSKKLREALKRDYTNPLVNVSLVEVRSRRYWILGRVFKPGLYPLRQPTTLLEAISQSGGLFTSRFSGTTEELADLSNSVVIRNGEILPVNFEKLIRSGDTSQNIYLHNNDYIYLPSAATSTVLLLGAVAAPQAIGYKDSLTLIDCIAQCKGPAKGAYLKEVVIVRGSLDKPAASIVNLEAILTGKETNVLLQPGDIVWIPKRPLGLLEATVQLVFQDAARTIASGEGSRVAGGTQDPVISIPLSSPP
ncbi:MAG: polysaccharide biosynthesis/export family protein [Akkermansiaceae bacterium]